MYRAGDDARIGLGIGAMASGVAYRGWRRSYNGGWRLLASSLPMESAPTMTSSDRVTRIRDRLEQALAPTHLEIIDDSHQHAGHAGARDGRGHYTVIIQSPAFAGLSMLAMHRRVYDALTLELGWRVAA